MTTIHLWRHNRNDKPWEITARELAERYVAWRGANPGARLRRDLVAFIVADEADGGLASSFDQDTTVFDLDQVEPIVQELRSR